MNIFIDSKQILERIYEGIMGKMHVVAINPHEWTIDFLSWWEANEHDGIELADIDIISVYFQEEGMLEGNKGVVYAIGEWLHNHHVEKLKDDEPTGMTWGEVVKRLMNEMTPEMLGQEATVWTEGGELHVYEVMDAKENGVVLHAC